VRIIIEITEVDFEPNVVINRLRGPGVGGIVSFIGTVRDFSEVRDEKGQVSRVAVKQLNYECYRDMAHKKMTEIREHALANFEIDEMHIIHKVGEIKPSDNIVMIAVSAAHRKESFRACEYAIDELKKTVPIWKKEITVSGEHWVGFEDNKGKKGVKK
jgi:molybdopterin synthase catalytic subunit